MRLLLSQHIDSDLDPVFIGRTLGGRFHVVWRGEIIAGAESLGGAIRLACKGPLHHTEFGLVPRFSPRLEDWTLCTGHHKADALRQSRRSAGHELAARPTRVRRAGTALERLARLEAANHKSQDPH